MKVYEVISHRVGMSGDGYDDSWGFFLHEDVAKLWIETHKHDYRKYHDLYIKEHNVDELTKEEWQEEYSVEVEE